MIGTADAVVLDSSFERLDELMHIGRRLRRIALQTAIGGIVLSAIGMLLAVMGLLPPIAGAIAQEVIDVLAILNAARVPLTRRAMAGAIVLESTMTVPVAMAAKTPPGPSRTFSTSGPSGSIVMRTVAALATSAGEPTAVAPSFTSSSTAPRLRLWTTTAKPFLSRLRAMGFPMRPRPMNPTVCDIEGEVDGYQLTVIS